MKAIDITGTGLSRKEADNPFSYNDDQITEKRLALKTMKELWGDVPDLYASWVYDLCKNTPEDELQDIMKKIDEEPSRFKGCKTLKKRTRRTNE